MGVVDHTSEGSCKNRLPVFALKSGLVVGGTGP